MGLVAEYEIACEGLPLVEVAAELPEATLAVEVQPTRDGPPPIVVTASGVDGAAVERAFGAAAFVDEYALIGEAGETRRYQVHSDVGMEAWLGEYVDDVEELRELAANESAIERIRATPDGWRQTGWFADRTAFDAFSDFWQRNAEFTLLRLAHDGEPEAPGEGLTDAQREALRVAYELGYFEVPRGASLADVADELGVGASALSERLRRAQSHLVETTVATTWPPLPE